MNKEPAEKTFRFCALLINTEFRCSHISHRSYDLLWRFRQQDSQNIQVPDHAAWPAAAQHWTPWGKSRRGSPGHANYGWNGSVGWCSAQSCRNPGTMKCSSHMDFISQLIHHHSYPREPSFPSTHHFKYNMSVLKIIDNVLKLVMFKVEHCKLHFTVGFTDAQI